MNYRPMRAVKNHAYAWAVVRLLVKVKPVVAVSKVNALVRADITRLALKAVKCPFNAVYRKLVFALP